MKELIFHCYFEENMTMSEIAEAYDLEVDDVKEILRDCREGEC